MNTLTLFLDFDGFDETIDVGFVVVVVGVVVVVRFVVALIQRQVTDLMTLSLKL